MLVQHLNITSSHLTHCCFGFADCSFLMLQAKVAARQVKADKLSSAVGAWGGSMLRKAFTTWKERHASWQQGHAKVARAAALWRSRAVAGAFQQWKEAAVYQQEVRLRLTGAVGKQSYHSLTQ